VQSIQNEVSDKILSDGQAASPAKKRIQVCSELCCFTLESIPCNTTVHAADALTPSA